MRESRAHNCAVIELMSLLRSTETQEKTLEFLNKQEKIEIKKNNNNDISTFDIIIKLDNKVVENKESKEIISLPGEVIFKNLNIFYLTHYNGPIDLIVDALKKSFFDKDFKELYNFRDSIVSKKDYNNLIKDYIDLILKYKGLEMDKLPVVEEYTMELEKDCLFSDLNQVLLLERDGLNFKAIALKPRKRNIFIITGKDDFEEIEKVKLKLRYNLYQYLKTAYLDLKEQES